MLREFNKVCAEAIPGRDCGGFKWFESMDACLSYIPSTKYRNIEEWLETFPHIYLSFEPNAIVTLYPRDYIFEQEDGKQCISFEELDDRIILGATFMRNHDILFDQVAGTVSIIRAQCNAEKDFDFINYYGKHDDSKVHEIRRNQVEQALLKARLKWIIWISFVLGVGGCALVLVCRIYIARYPNRSPNLGNAVEFIDVTEAINEPLGGANFHQINSREPAAHTSVF